jgi:hypothetical protein
LKNHRFDDMKSGADPAHRTNPTSYAKAMWSLYNDGFQTNKMNALLREFLKI